MHLKGVCVRTGVKATNIQVKNTKMCINANTWRGLGLPKTLTRGRISTEIRSVSLRSSSRYLNGKNVARGKSDTTAICASTRRGGANSTSATIALVSRLGTQGRRGPRRSGFFSRSARQGRGSLQKSGFRRRSHRRWAGQRGVGEVGVDEHGETIGSIIGGCGVSVLGFQDIICNSSPATTAPGSE